MAYQQNLADFRYQGIPGNKVNLIDLVKASLEAEYGRRTMDSRVSQSENDARQGGLTNDNMQMTVDQNTAIQPGVMDELRQESGSMLHPAMQAAQAHQQPMGQHPAMQAQQAPTQDPYAAQQALMEERNQLLQRSAQHPAALAMSPALAAINKNREANIKGREDLAGDQFGMRVNQDWQTLKPQLDALMTPGPKGWNPLKGEKAVALSKAIAVIPPYMSASPQVKQWIADQKAEQQTQVFNPAAMANVNSRFYAPLLTDWRSAREKYEKQYGEPFLQIQGIKNSGAYGTSVGDQSMIDKLIIMETGKPPTEAQYSNLAHRIGFSDMFDIFAGKFANGQQLSAEMRKNLESEIEEQARIGHQAYAENMGQAKEQASLMNLDPNAVIRPGGSYGQVDDHMKRKPEVASKKAPGPYDDASKEARYQAWKKANGH